MNYRVEWAAEAGHQLAQAWLQATDRSAVSAASYQIDRLLAEDPRGTSESRSDEFRNLLSPPLGCHFYIDDPNQLVVVVSCWLIRSRRKS